MEHRDRATGWKYAKLSGHKNEELVKILLDENPEFSQRFLQNIDFQNTTILNTSIGGLHETNIPGVNGKNKKQNRFESFFIKRKTG